MNDLLEELEAAIAETERIAREALNNPSRYDSSTGEFVDVGLDDGEWKTDGHYVESANRMRAEGVYSGGITIYDEGGHTEEQATHIALNDPKSVLRSVVRDRKVLERHKPVEQWGGHITGKPWLISTSCSYCWQAPDGDYGGYGASREWPCDDVRDLAEDYEIEMPGHV